VRGFSQKLRPLPARSQSFRKIAKLAQAQGDVLADTGLTDLRLPWSRQRHARRRFTLCGKLVYPLPCAFMLPASGRAASPRRLKRASAQRVAHERCARSFVGACAKRMRMCGKHEANAQTRKRGNRYARMNSWRARNACMSKRARKHRILSRSDKVSRQAWRK
jgi:hypothetical protein